MLEAIVLKKIGNTYLVVIREIKYEKDIGKIVRVKGLKEVTVTKEQIGKLEREWHNIEPPCDTVREAEIIVDAIKRCNNG